MMIARVFFAFCLLALAASLIGASPAAPSGRAAGPMVLELFSSQNCEACPKANLLMGELSADPGVLVLTYGVDYWDYLGWPDTFAQPDFVGLQKHYAARFDLRGPYTPQLVINGAFQCSGAKRKDVEKKMALASASTAGPAVRLSPGAGGTADLVIEGRNRGEILDVWLIAFDPGMTRVTPKSGSNRGRDLVHFNVVKGRTLLTTFSGGTVRQSVACETGCAVLIQRTGQGEILAAGWSVQTDRMAP